MNETILNCIRLRFVGKQLQQLLRVRLDDAGETVEVEEWRPVVVEDAALPSPNGHVRPASYNWMKVDWAKSNLTIHKDTGYSILTVMKYRDLMGFPPIRKSGTGSGTPVKVSEEQINKADWLLERDSDLGKKWGVTRERVRQIRLMLGKPLVIPALDRRHGEMKKWLLEHKSEIEGKHISEVARMIPCKGASMPAKRRAIRHSGITFDDSPEYYPAAELKGAMINFDLPNSILARIWGANHYRFSVFRHNASAGKAKWNVMGFCLIKTVEDPAFVSAIDSEITNARRFGRAVNSESLVSDLKSHVEELKNKLTAKRLKTLTPT